MKEQIDKTKIFEGCSKYIKKQDRICGNYYAFKNKKDSNNFIEKTKTNGKFLCEDCMNKFNEVE